MDIKGALNRIVNQLDLTTEEMQAVMRQIMTGQCTDAQIGAFLMGMRMKSETIDEIVGAVAVMRELADGVQLPTLKHVVDVVGTGGDGARLPCLATLPPAAATTKDAAEDTLKMFAPSPPVPTTSTTCFSVGNCTPSASGSCSPRSTTRR